jgi:ribosome maturation factor RimP
MAVAAMVKNNYTFRRFDQKWAMPAFFVSGVMETDATIARVWELAAPLAEGEGMEIVDIQFRHEGSRQGKVLRLYLDKENGPNVDDLARVSRQLGELLDVHDAVEGAYTLEVSSPGINRPLKKREHFERYVGKRIRVRTREMIDGRRSFLGVLEAVSRSQITVKQEGKVYRIDLSDIERSNYEHDWSA